MSQGHFTYHLEDGFFLSKCAALGQNKL